MPAHEEPPRDEAPGEVETPVPVERPRAPTLFLVFLRLGAMAFGGPAMVPYIEDLVIRRRRWLSEDHFREGVALCQSIPGATSMQTAAYVGLRAGGVRGAAAAYAGFVLPAAILMLAASVAYRRVASLATVQATFLGFHAVVVALVANAALRYGRTSIRSVLDAILALACVLALHAGVSPVLVIAGAILLAMALGRRDAPSASAPAPSSGLRVEARTVIAILAAGTAILVALLALAPRLGALAAVCMKVDVLAFGGGFASVPLMYREMVTARSWLDPHTFMDGIALGQVTPGPIVITATFVGYQIAGPAGALVATAAVFFPSFVILLVAAPFFSALRAHAWFERGVHGALLSFVGLLVHVTFQFAHAVGWTVGSGLLAAAALGALLAGVDVLWVVLCGGFVAAMTL